MAWGIVVFFLVDRARGLLDATPTLERVVFLVEMAAALGFLLRLLRPRRLAAIPPQLRRAPYHRLVGAAMRVAAAVLALAIVADLAGWGDLASLLGDGALLSGFLGLFVFVLLKVFQSLATFALVLWPLRLLRAISQHRLLVRRRLEQVLSVLAVGLWAMLVFRQLGLLGPASAGVGRALDAGVSVGSLSVSVGGVMAFAVTVWLSFLLARLTDFVLQEDVFTRVHTGRGVPYAISGLVRYTLIFLGFLVGLAAAGFELTKLAIVAGGLGVGIGFGLQNVVNNFVNFGDSALEFTLRVWIEKFDDRYSTRSELAVATQEALEHAGIGVPFPQRDLHLVSVSPNAASDLGTATRPSPRPTPPTGSSDGS